MNLAPSGNDSCLHLHTLDSRQIAVGAVAAIMTEHGTPAVPARGAPTRFGEGLRYGDKLPMPSYTVLARVELVVFVRGTAMSHASAMISA